MAVIEPCAHPSRYFGSQHYFDGHPLKANGYIYKDALLIKHETTGIFMWAHAVDVQKNAGHRGLREGDRVLYHYTHEAGFRAITKLDNVRLIVNRNATTEGFFGLGIYGTGKAPHEFDNKEQILLNNYYPTAENFRNWAESTEIRVQPDLPRHDAYDADSFGDMLRTNVGRYVQETWAGRSQYCIPMIVDEYVSKDVMKHETDDPAMPNGPFDA